MNEETGATYSLAKHARALGIAECKVGKTCFEIASMLGVLPWQKQGGIVSDPRNLHVIATDSASLAGVKRFMLESCGAPEEALNYRIYNLQDDIRRTVLVQHDWSMELYNMMIGIVQKIGERASATQGVSAVLVASLTGLANGMERALVGPPTGPGYSDPSKWKALAHHLHEVQNYLQVDSWHCWWEAHLDKGPDFKMKKKDDNSGMADNLGNKESIRVSGEAGRSWAYNTDQVFRIRRSFGMVHPGTKVDTCYLDTKPSFDFIANGRNFTEALSAKEPDMTAALAKLGLRVGHWGAKTNKPAGKPVPVAPASAK